ncbi:MAG: hypothetical protein JXQ67_07640 [Campylobacterales bacterium]|nr:hypothetical protein [Campylobacterales bacterium]
MRYIVNVRLDKETRTYNINAKNEEEAKERLLLRLPPNQRDKCHIDDIKIDPKSFLDTEPYGIFAED